MNKRERVRIGVMGPSWWVNYWHLVALKTHPHVDFVAVSSPELAPDFEVEAREKYGPEVRVYFDNAEMIRKESLDGAIVCTPNDVHHPATMLALNSGLHVVCEKPVAMNATLAREMADTAKAKGLLGLCNFVYRGNPCVQQFRKMVADGWLGKPLTISGSYHGGYAIGGGPGWRRLRSRSGSGILGDLGSHLIDLARYISGDEFGSVCAHSLTALWNEGTPPDIMRTEDPRAGDRNDDSTAFLAEFKGGAQGIFHTSWVAYQGALCQHQEVEIYGTEGRLHFLATHAGTFLRGLKCGSSHWEQFHVPGTTHPAVGMEGSEDFFRPGRFTPSHTTYRWIEAIHAGENEISPNLEDGWKAQCVIDAVIRASAERRWIEV